MSTTALPPNPCLLAILLVIQTRAGAGAQVVFHYPPDPLSEDQSDLRQQETDLTGDAESSSSDSDDGSSSEDNDFEVFTRRARKNSQFVNDSQSHLTDEDDDYSVKGENQPSDGNWKPSWEPLLGLGEDGLVSLLAPGRAWHKRKLEMGINNLTFLGRPVYAREDGNWQRRKRRRKQSPDIASQVGAQAKGDLEDDDEQDDVNSSDEEDEKAIPNRYKSRKESKSALTMFNVVFVMDPPPLEQAHRVKEMYDHVVKKFSKALKWVQVHNDYVWQQSEIIQNIRLTHLSPRSSPKSFHTECIKQSSLADALATIYKAISASRIAAVTLVPQKPISLQIPPITSTAVLPSLTDPPLEPGLWLTTANESPTTASDLDSASASGALMMAKNYTLLLKASPQKILKDIQTAGGPLAGPLATYIESGRPTKSFYKISIASHISLADIQLLARHLIYWRRAIAIPPLHQRDTYIVSPNADFSKLVEASKQFETMFPMVPSLPKILSLLSETPTPFGSLVPSSDHKEEYYRVLAHLMRYGWVTQLRTFAYVRVDPAVKKAVRDKEREDMRHRSRSHSIRTDTTTTSASNSTATAANTTRGASPSSSNTATEDYTLTKRPSLVSQRSSDGVSKLPTASSFSSSVTGPSSLHQQHGSKFKSISGASSSSNTKYASLILSPLRASGEESRWLEYIADSLLSSPFKDISTTTATTEGRNPSISSAASSPPPSPSPSPSPSPYTVAVDADTNPAADNDNPTTMTLSEKEELRHYWLLFVKYFNGKEALEKIPIMENLKRKLVADLLDKMGVGVDGGGGGGGERGDGKGDGRAGGKGVVVTFRHW